MYEYLLRQAGSLPMPAAGILAAALTSVFIVLAGITAFFVLHRFVAPLLTRLAQRTPTDWDEICVRRGALRYATWLAAGVLVHGLARVWLVGAPSWAHVFRVAAHFWMLTAVVFLINALLDAIHDIYNRFACAHAFPIRVFIQVLKLGVIFVAMLIAVSALLNRSPVLLVSGLGAMTAILMLVFKDPILGFVAGIQLTANRMLAVGDWLEMPKYNADGDVVDITLTTVKVSNWDRTITTIPTYALISDSFKNWRGMTEAGGRRIKRSVCLDMNSIHFLDQDEIRRLGQLQLLSRYITDKIREIEDDNREKGVDPASPANGRHLTNVGTFRAYLVAYLRRHANIHQDMIMIVRQLQPTSSGLPIEIYAFTNDTRWVPYEGIQSDIFDHVLAVAPEFGLRVFQDPSGGDVRSLATALASGTKPC